MNAPSCSLSARTPTPLRRLLVTGATGTVGRHVVDALRHHPGVEVRVGTRRPWACAGEVARVPLDFDDPATLPRAFEGVDAFFFVSPLGEEQVAQAARLIEAAVSAGVRRCVRLSSRAAGWDHECILRRWHREIEAALVSSGLLSTVLRPCSFMDNVLGAPLDLARTRGIFSIPLGAGRIPFVDTRDVGEAAARCLLSPDEHRGATYVLTGATALSGGDVAQALSRRLGRDVRYEPTPLDVARRRGQERGLPGWLVESGLRVYARAQGGDEAGIDPSLARLLGRPPGSFEAFLEREVPLSTGQVRGG